MRFDHVGHHIASFVVQSESLVHLAHLLAHIAVVYQGLGEHLILLARFSGAGDQSL